MGFRSAHRRSLLLLGILTGVVFSTLLSVIGPTIRGILDFFTAGFFDLLGGFAAGWVAGGPKRGAFAAFVSVLVTPILELLLFVFQATATSNYITNIAVNYYLLPILNPFGDFLPLAFLWAIFGAIGGAVGEE